MIIPCEYHDPALVQAIGRAIVRSAVECVTYAVVIVDGGSPRIFPHAHNIRHDDHRLVFSGYVCEEHKNGQAIRRCIFTPVAFRCEWVDA